MTTTPDPKTVRVWFYEDADEACSPVVYTTAEAAQAAGLAEFRDEDPDSALHYEWQPFVNLPGRYRLLENGRPTGYMVYGFDVMSGAGEREPRPDELPHDERGVCGVQLPADSAQRLGADPDIRCARPDGHVAHDDGNGVLWVSRPRAEQDEQGAIDRNIADLLSDENLDAHRISASIQAAIRELLDERDKARELARVSLDILRNVSDEPMRELYGVDDFDEMPAWFTGYGKPGGKR